MRMFKRRTNGRERLDHVFTGRGWPAVMVVAGLIAALIQALARLLTARPRSPTQARRLGARTVRVSE